MNGRLGPKKLFGWQANNFSDRLTGPLVRGGGRLVETDRDTAMCRVECPSLGGTNNPKRHPTPQGIAF
jgi:hypothetical protein